MEVSPFPRALRKGVAAHMPNPIPEHNNGSLWLVRPSLKRRGRGTASIMLGVMGGMVHAVR